MSNHQAFLLNDHRVSADTIDDTLTTATEAGPQPGAAVYSGSHSRSRMVLATSGVMASDEELHVHVERGGYPDGARPAGALYSKTAGGTKYGWDPPNHAGWEYLRFNSGSGGEEYGADIAVTATGRVLAVTHNSNGSPPAIILRTYDPGTHTWASGTFMEDESITGGTLSPQLVVADDGLIYVFHLRELTGGGASVTQLQLAVWMSTDDGDSFTLVTRDALPDPIALSISAEDHVAAWLRVAFSEGNFAGFLELLNLDTVDEPKVYQLGSTTGDRFESQLLTGSQCRPAIVPVPGGGGFLATMKDRSTDTLAFFRIGTPFEWVESLPFYELGLIDNTQIADGANPHNNGEYCLWTGEDGAFYILIAGQYTTQPVMLIYRSRDALNWKRHSTAIVNAGITGGNRQLLTDCSAADVQGATIVLSGIETTKGTVDSGSILVTYAGGHTSLTMPPDDEGGDDAERFGWESVFLGVEEPSSIPWTGTTIGVPTRGVDEKGWKIDCSSTQAHYWTATNPPGASTTRALVAEVTLESESGAVLSSTRAGARFTFRDGTDEYVLEVNVSPTGFALYDRHGSVQSPTYAVTGQFKVRVQMLQGDYAVWYRAVDSAIESTWTLAASGSGGSGITSSANAGASHVLEWGCIDTTSGQSAVLYVSEFKFGELRGGAISDNGFAGAEPFPRALTRLPATYPGGVKVAALSGPAVKGDSWSITPDHVYGFKHLFSNRRSREWRSQADTTTQRIAFDLSGAAEDAGLPFSIGLALFGCNFDQFRLYGRTHAGAETLLKGSGNAPVSTGIGTFSWTRRGDELTATPANGLSVSHWVEHNELAGRRFVDIVSGKGFTIRSNTSGMWAADDTEKPLRIYLEDHGPLTATSGTGKIVCDHSLTVLHGITDAYRYLILEITGFVTGQDFYKIERAFLGPLHIFGRATSWDREQGRAHNVDLHTAEGGARSAAGRGRQRREMVVAWPDGIQERELYGSTRQNVQAGGEIVATLADTARLMDGLFAELDGPKTPFVYAPAVSVTDSSSVITALQGAMYARLTPNKLARSTIQGNELTDEIVRVNQVPIEEEF